MSYKPVDKPGFTRKVQLLPYGAENRLNSCEISVFNAIALPPTGIASVFGRGWGRDEWGCSEIDILELE